MKTKIITLLITAAITSLCFAQNNPADSGLVPKTATFEVNRNYNNTSTESTGVQIAANNNVLIGWEDDFVSGDILDQEAVWTLYDANGNLLTPAVTVTNANGSQSLANYTYRAYFRANGSPTPGYAAWGPKIKANLFGNGLGMGATAFGFDLEVVSAEYSAIQTNAAGANAGDFPAVQLLDNIGNPGTKLSGAADADAEPDGDIRVGDWEYLSNGNIVITGESRQAADRALTGQAAGNVVAFRIVTPAGAQVKGYTPVSSEPISSDAWGGVGVTANGFAVRFNGGGVGIVVRMFDNAGNPTTSNINLTTLTGQNQGGNRGDASGFHGNGTDAYVNINSVNPGTGNTPWVTVLNADGTLRYSRAVGDAGDLPASDRVDAAIAPDGRVIAVFDNRQDWHTNADPYALSQGRILDQSGNPVGGSFWLSERETPANTPTGTGIGNRAVQVGGDRPRVAWRGNHVAIIWESRFSTATASRVVAGRMFTITNLPPAIPSIGLAPRTPTIDVNTNYNNTSTESTGVQIAHSRNVLIGWEDDFVSGDILDQEAVWSLYSASGRLLTPAVTVTNANGSQSLANYTYRAFFRANGSPTPGYAAWGPKIKANLFGNGLGMGATAFGFDLEVVSAEYSAIQTNAAGANAGDFPAVQLLDNIGNPGTKLSGAADADAEPDGDIRIGDWDYLSNGNIVIVGESRQAADRTLTGQTGGNVPVFRIVTPTGTQVKGYTAVSSTSENAEIWHGVGVTANGFAVRFAAAGVATVRLFDNAGNPTTTNINIPTLTGNPATGGGGRGDGTGFHGNGADAYILISSGNPGTGNTPFVTVLNADGTLRYSRAVGDAADLPASDRVDAAIAPDGRVIAVFDNRQDWHTNADPYALTQARIFDRNGRPASGMFFVSERETPANTPTGTGIGNRAVQVGGDRPRVAWRGSDVAIIWESRFSPGTASRVVSFRLFTLTNLITQIVETGGDNEATDTIPAKWTGRTFPVSQANEPVPGLVVGDSFTAGGFGNGAGTFVDRNHIYTNASPTVLIPSYLADGEYIMSGNDNRDNPSLTMDVTVSQPVDVYLLIDNRNGDGSNANPPTFTGTNMQWVLDQRWAAVKSGINRTANRSIPDEVGIDEAGDGGINNWYSIYTKSFPAGTFQLKQADNNGQNMYGAVVTVQQRMTIGQVGANIVIAFPAGYRLQRATSVNGPWTDVSGTSPVTEPISPGERYYRGVSP